MTYYVPNGNWTSSVKNTIGSSSPDGISLYPINYDTGNPDPANGCSPKTFYATYKCGKETTKRNISAIQNAVGKTARFNCSTLFERCSRTTLHLGDDGILTLKDKDNKIIWDSTQSPMNASRLSSDTALALDDYKPISTNGTPNPDPNMPYKRSFLNSGEFLTIGQYMSSPSGKCRLEMVDTNPSVITPWVTVIPPFTTTDDKTIIRERSTNTSNSWKIRIIPTSGTSVTRSTDYTVMEKASTQGKNWITIGGDGDIITVPANSIVRYGLNGNFITKTYTTETRISVPLDLHTFDSNPLCDAVPNTSSTICATVPVNTLVKYGANDSWLYKTVSGSFTANDTFFGGNPLNTTDTKRAYKSNSIVLGSTTENMNILQISMTGNAQGDKILQVNYYISGCSINQPIDASSSSLYTIPWTYRENLGKMGYVNEYGQLQAYTDETMVGSYSNNFTKLPNIDNSSFGMYGSNLGEKILDVDIKNCEMNCKTYGNENIGGSTPVTGQCAGFEYEKIGKTCQLKGNNILTTGIRYNNPSNNSKNYEYYARSKGVKGVDISCPKNPEDIVSGMTTDWKNMTPGTAMTPTTKCGLLNAVGNERAIVNAVDASLNTIAEQFSDTINNLYTKYQKLKNRLMSDKTKLSDNLNELKETKQDLADWSGEQSEQLDALNEDSDLNMMSKNYKHIMWSILAILIIIVIIKITMSFDTTDIAKTLDITKIPEAISSK